MFRSNIPNVERKVRQKVIEGMEKVINDLTRRSKRLAPLDTGNLRGSGFGEVDATGSDEVIGTVIFNAGVDDNGNSYALIQHENMAFRHPRGGQAKYLEQPLNENRDKYKQFIKNKIREVTE